MLGKMQTAIYSHGSPNDGICSEKYVLSDVDTMRASQSAFYTHLEGTSLLVDAVLIASRDRTNMIFIRLLPA